jgi:hypothetical protein
MIGPTVGTPGGGSGGADMAPTAQQIAVNNEFKLELGRIQAEFKQLVDVATPAFNTKLKAAGVTTVIQP